MKNTYLTYINNIQEIKKDIDNFLINRFNVINIGSNDIKNKIILNAINTYYKKYLNSIKFNRLNYELLDLLNYNRSGSKFRINDFCQKICNNKELSGKYFNNNTMSLLSLFLFFKKNNIKNLYIQLPCYNVIFEIAQTLKFKIKFINGINKINITNININNIKDNSVLLITSPILFIGELYDNKCINTLNNFIRTISNKNIFVVCDESITLNNNRLINNLEINDNTFFIYSPYKSISINGDLKFSAIISTKKTISMIDKIDFINHYCATYLNMNKLHKNIDFFLSSYYDNLYNILLKYAKNTFYKIKEIINKYPNDIITMPNCLQCSMTSICIHKKINYSYDFYKKFILNYNIALYPSDIVKNISSNNDYYFRINLLAYDEQTTIKTIKFIIKHLI